MNKEFVPYEEALALKELDFEEPCLGWYLPEIANKGNMPSVILGSYMNKWNKFGDRLSAPLYQQAFRWFREKYKLQAEILWRGDMECFCYKTGKFKYGSHDFSKDDYKTYEEAELECLKKLIEIVK
jgi:hypothetical protein